MHARLGYVQYKGFYPRESISPRWIIEIGDSPTTKISPTLANVGASDGFSSLAAQTCGRNVRSHNRFAGVPRRRNEATVIRRRINVANRWEYKAGSRVCSDGQPYSQGEHRTLWVCPGCYQSPLNQKKEKLPC